MRKSILWYATGMIVFIILVVVRNITFFKIKEFANSVNHSREIVKTLQNISSHLKSAEIYSPRFEKTDTLFYRFQTNEAKKLYTDVRDLREFVKSNPDLVPRADTLEYLLREQTPTLMRKNIVEIIQSGEGFRLQALYKIETIINGSIELEERRLMEQRASLNEYIRQSNILAIVLVSISAIIFISAFAANYRSAKTQKWLSVFLGSVLSSAKHAILSFSAAEQKKTGAPAYTVDYANTTAHQLLGFDEGALLGKSLTDITLLNQQEFIKMLPAVLDEGKEFNDQLNFDNKWVMVYCVKRSRGFTVSLYDITSLKENEEALKYTIEKLELNNNQLEKYAYAASHDFQEPLRKISIFAERIRKTEQNLDANQKLFFEKILSSTARMSELIKDTLEYSLVQRLISFQQVDLNHTLKEVQDDLEVVITQKQATISVELLPVIDGIAVQLRQLFFNLLSNALKFTETGRKPHISVTRHSLTAAEIKSYPNLSVEKNYVSIKVADNGIGFEAGYATLIFELFTKLHTQTKFKGTGIGLALCKQVVVNHHGHIFAESSPGSGASFTIILPVEKD